MNTYRNHKLYLDNLDKLRIINFRKSLVYFFLILLFFNSEKLEVTKEEKSISLFYNLLKEYQLLTNLTSIFFTITFDMFIIFFVVYWLKKEDCNYDIIISFVILFTISLIINILNYPLIDRFNINEHSLFKSYYPSILNSISYCNNSFNLPIGSLNIIKNYLYDLYDKKAIKDKKDKILNIYYILFVFIVLLSIYLVMIHEVLSISILFGYLTSELIHLNR